MSLHEEIKEIVEEEINEQLSSIDSVISKMVEKKDMQSIDFERKDKLVLNVFNAIEGLVNKEEKN